MFYNFKKNKKAFTLVELIVVIAIIAILGAVVGVTVSSFVNKARKTAATEPLNGIAGNWDSYLVDSPDMTLKDLIKDLIKEDDRAGFSVSAQAMWGQKISAVNGNIYFHSTDSGKYWGQLKIENGVVKKSNVTPLDSEPSTKYNYTA